jgi:threonine/homoserine/homoserine lactone efflux protein
MPHGHELLLFVAAGWLLNLTPGADVLYIVGHSLRAGRRAGLMASLGVVSGCLLHVTAAAIGVSALLAASATAFTALKLLGALYLLWLGLRLLFSRQGGLRDVAGPGAPNERPRALRTIFAGGFLTNALNPKVALFFLAFVPQFIAPGAADKPLAFLLLGLLFTANSLPVNAGWAFAAGWLGRHQAVRHRLQWLERSAAVLFIGFGLKLAFADHPNPSPSLTGA